MTMLGTNAAAVLLPLNGMTTEEVSDTYSNLFAPAGLTFTIWSLIYLLLAVFVVYQWLAPTGKSILSDQKISGQLRILFILSSILNSAWLFAWQYLQIDLSVLIMLGLLITLIYINQVLAKASLNKKESIFVRLPFSVYFGWITIATIANITAFFVDKNIDFFQNNQILWTVIILAVGVFIVSWTIIHNQDVAYGLVALWAYFGILLKHQSVDGWNQKYPMIITTVIVCLVILVVVCVYELFLQIKNKKKAT
ncbi:hypothetical protein RV12_GL000296 [Enterococcus quebecensis]|nr:hypothetical protein RV12_GL000296 [Enterococcus quebecensis]